MKIAIIICTFNRPQYLKECFRSLKAADIPEGTSIIIVDDGSTDQKTIELIQKFDYPGCSIARIFKGTNRGIKNSLLMGYDHAFVDAELAINLDSDAIVRKDFIKVLVGLKKMFPSHIVSGFNTTVLNRNPIISIHNPVSKRGFGFYKKKYASGINMCINEDQLQEYILPALKSEGNWDFSASLLHEKDGKAVIVAKPSVIAHIGIHSAMGHGISEPPDISEDFFLHNLSNVTLIGASSSDLNGLIQAADISSKYIKFGDVKLLSSLQSNDSRVVKIDPITSKAAYNKFVLKELVNHVTTEYFLIIQPDGYLLNSFAWTDDFFNYEVIGAWWNFEHVGYPGMHCANGGFSLRSTRLHKILRDDPLIIPTNDRYITDFNEDHVIGKIYRQYLEEKYSVKFAPKDVCEKFSIEAFGVPPPGNKYNESLGFHGWNVDFSDAILDHIPVKR